MTYRVEWGKRVDGQLGKIPAYLRDKFLAWVLAVERVGLPEVRRLAGFHDEPLKGVRAGQRSIRLNRAYRVIYTEKQDGTIRIVQVIDVSKHEY